MKILNFSQAKQFLFQQIPESLSQIFTAGRGLRRTKYFLKLLGEPQNKLKVVHIAGTSGKGSTAYLISLILKSLGFEVGLTVSPHLLDIRERVQIDGQMISKQKFASHLNELVSLIEKAGSSLFGRLTYFEISTSLAFHTFWKEKVDYAVIETGLGGLYDATNVATHKDKVVVITKLGFDHAWILGKTLAKIASQKAGIIQKSNTVISLWQKPPARVVIKKIARQKKAQLFFINKGAKARTCSLGSITAGFSNVRLTPEATFFDFYSSTLKMKGVKLSLIGFHQAENCSLALATVFFLSQRDGFKFNLNKVRKGLQRAHFPGRFEKFKLKGKTVILDGAHNPQKMAALTKTLKEIWPEEKFNFLLAIKRDKNYRKMLKYIAPLARQVLITNFTVSGQDLIHRSEEPELIGKVLTRLGYQNYQLIPDLKKALKRALSVDHGHLVITGSLYLLAEIYPFL